MLTALPLFAENRSIVFLSLALLLLIIFQDQFPNPGEVAEAIETQESYVYREVEIFVNLCQSLQYGKLLLKLYKLYAS